MSEHTLFTVERGQPDETELAVLTAVLMAVLRDAGQPAGRAGTSAFGGAPRRATWGAARSRRIPAVSWAAP
jgi:hypothetical protein